MKYLLDINALLAAILAVHPKHQVADSWITEKELMTCPLSELGFLRISTNPKVYGVSMPLARKSLEAFIATHNVEFLPADLPVLKSRAPKSDAVTDCYLADLAASRNMRLATFDKQIIHPAIELID